MESFSRHSAKVFFVPWCTFVCGFPIEREHCEGCAATLHPSCLLSVEGSGRNQEMESSIALKRLGSCLRAHRVDAEEIFNIFLLLFHSFIILNHPPMIHESSKPLIQMNLLSRTWMKFQRRDLCGQRQRSKQNLL
jgi:hypothetical protein